MDKYKVVVSPKSFYELEQIYKYIANEKMAPINAKSQVDRIKKSILKLQGFHFNFITVEYFCFTNDEVKRILKYYEKEEKYQEVCEWYDGYYFGNTKIFNPWSVLNKSAVNINSN